MASVVTVPLDDFCTVLMQETFLISVSTRCGMSKATTSESVSLTTLFGGIGRFAFAAENERRKAVRITKVDRGPA